MLSVCDIRITTKSPSLQTATKVNLKAFMTYQLPFFHIGRFLSLSIAAFRESCIRMMESAKRPKIALVILRT